MASVKAVPGVIVEIEGEQVDPHLIGNLGEVRVRQRLSLPVLCEATFMDPPDRRRSVGNRVKPGSALRVSIEGIPHSLFEGEVTAVEYVFEPGRGIQVKVRGYDLLHRLQKNQRIRVFDSLDGADLAFGMTSPLGLSVEAGECGPTWDRIMQWGQSDFEILRDVLDRSGLYFFLSQQVVHVFSLQGRSERIPLRLGTSLLEARIEINGDPACRSVKALGWDLGRVQGRHGAAGAARQGRRTLSEIDPGRIGSSGERLVLNEVWAEDAQADAMAQAELDRRFTNEVVMWGVASGNPNLEPGLVIEVEGMDPSLDGDYVLTEVNHTIDGRRGFLSELTTRVVPSPPRAGRPVITVGIVSSVDDPERLGRIRTVLPSLGDIETGWLGVLAAGAGAKKGFVALPDVDDQVLVFFAGSDLTQGVVLGGLFGVKDPPDYGLDDNEVRRYTWQTPSGQKIILDETGSRIRMENGQGSYVELSADKVLFHAMQELEIRAPGNPVVISGSKIDFRRA